MIIQRCVRDSTSAKDVEGNSFEPVFPYWLYADFDIRVAQVNLIVIDSLTSHLRPTLDSQTRRLMNDLIRSTLTTICAYRRVSVRSISHPFTSHGMISDRPFCLQFIVTTKMSIKLFGLDNRPSSWSRDAEAMMVPAIRSNEWLPSQERLGEGVWKVLLYFDQQGERCDSYLSFIT